MLGVGEAPTFPANAKAVGHWFPQQERSFATSLFDAAAKFAPAIGVPLIGGLLLWMGWRISFAATGLVSLLYFVLFFAVYREPEEDPGLTAEELAFIREGSSERSGPPGRSQSLWELLRQRKVLGLAIGFGSYNYVFYLLLTWLPSYLVVGAAHRSAALIFVHGRAVAGGDGDGSGHRGAAGGLADPAGLESRTGCG